MGALAGQGRRREGRHEFLRARREERTHRRPALAQAPDQVEGLVGRDPPADDEEDAAIGEGGAHDVTMAQSVNNEGARAALL
jgi:hypothetical protein